MLAQRRRLDALRAYVPEVVLRRLAAHASPGGAETFGAALMLVDITGFSSVASALVERGPAGTEELSRTLNDYLGRIIDVVREHGGDVTKIVGDGVVPIWPAIDEDLAIATHRATVCGLAITSSLNDLEIGADLRLALKVGVCAGDVIAAHVGGLDGRWLFVTAGTGPAQLSAIEPHLQTGGVVLSPEAWTLVMDSAVGQPIDGGPVRVVLARPGADPRPLVPVPLDPEHEPYVRTYVPSVGLAQLDAGYGEWLGEIRRTTVMFVDIRGLSATAPDLAVRLNELTTAGQRVISRYQGWLKEITTDDKGTTLVAAFGVPPLTHEDDPARGVQSALAIATELRGLGLGVGIGIATGSAFYGPVGGPTRRDLAVIGPHVNLASRLAKAAREDAVLADSATREAARDRAVFDRLPGYVLKGTDMPVEVHRVRPPASRSHRSSFVDRSAELAETATLLSSLEEGIGGLVLLEGEPGIGKSRLVAEWVAEARRRGVRCLVGGAEEIESATPYHAWRPVFEDLLVLVEASAERRRIIALDRLQADEGTDRLAPLLGQVLSLELPDNDTTRQFSGAVRADYTRDLLVRLVAREAERTRLMVVLEDAHWLDSASWALTARAMRIRQLLLVMTTRPFARPTSDESVERARSQARTIALLPLAREDALSLASDRMGAAVSPQIAALLHERTEGNPLFIEQLAYAMRDEGRVVIEAGVARASPTADVRSEIIPHTIQRVITSRLDQLPPGEALTVKVASVIGRRFALRTLLHIYPVAVDEATLREHLHTLTRMDLITRDASAKEPTYAFGHVITQEVAYNLMLPARSAPVHRALAEWYERTYSDDMSPYHAFLAHHWSKAGAVANAVDHLELAGAQALRSFANEEAVRSFEQAIALDRSAALRTTPTRRARWELQLGEAYVLMSRYTEGRPHLEAGLRLFGRPAPTGTGQQIAWLLAELVKQALRRGGVLTRMRTPTGQDRVDLVAVLRAYERLAEASYYARERLLPLYCVIRILNSAEASGIPDEIARGLAGTGALFGVIPVHRAATWYVQRAARLLEHVDDVPTAEIVGIVVAFYYVGAGHWDLARQHLVKVKEAAIRFGDRRRLDDALSNLLELEYLRGSFQTALAVADELRVSASARDDRRFLGEALAGRAYCLLQAGNSGEALKSLRALRALGEDVPIDVRIKLAGILAMTHLERGERQQAIAAKDDATRLTGRQRPEYVGTFAGYVGPAEVDLALLATDPDLPELRGRARGSLSRLRAYAGVFPIARPRVAILTGRYHAILEESAQALKAWRRALADAIRLEMPFEQALAHYEIGRHLGASEAEGARHLATARALLKELGASRALTAVEVAAASAAAR